MQQNATKFQLKKFHYLGIELRYGGKTYQEIAEILTEQSGNEFNQQRIRRWFMSGGILETEYLDFARKENERRRQIVIEELKKVIPLIPVKFQSLLERKDKDGNEKLDSITLGTLKVLCEILNFKVPANDQEDEEDPIDAYFDRAEKELGIR